MKPQMPAMLRVVAVLVVGTACACAPARGPNPAAQRETLAMDLRNPDEARESFFGDAMLFTVAGLGTAVAVDGGYNRGTQDGYVDQLFVLQHRQPPATAPRLLRSVELFYAGRVLLIRRAGMGPIVLAVQMEGDPDPALGWLGARASRAERFMGLGLSRHTGAWDILLRDVPSASMARLFGPAPPPFSRVGP